MLLTVQEGPIFHGYRTLTLTASPRAELGRARDADRRPYPRARAAALLKVAAGWSARAVARAGRLRPRDPDAVYAWLNRHERAGLAGLLARPRGHRGLSPLRGRRAQGGRPSAPVPLPD